MELFFYLLNSRSNPNLSEGENKPESNFKALKFTDLIEEAQNFREQGNSHFKSKNFRLAIDHYTKGYNLTIKTIFHPAYFPFICCLHLLLIR